MDIDTQITAAKEKLEKLIASRDLNKAHEYEGTWIYKPECGGGCHAPPDLNERLKTTARVWLSEQK